MNLRCQSHSEPVPWSSQGGVASTQKNLPVLRQSLASRVMTDNESNALNDDQPQV